jgi:hypothetical protein
MKKNIYLFALLIIVASSCKKASEGLSPTPTEPAKNFKSIQTDPSFNWETSQAITLKVFGFATEAVIVNTLKVTSTDGKSIYFTALHKMNESLTSKLVIPIDEKEVLVQYGSIVKKYSLSSKQIDFDFTIENPE